MGKSSLFNALVGKRIAIVHDTPGTSRDSIKSAIRSGKYEFELVDTGGVPPKTPKTGIEKAVLNQTISAIKDSSISILVCNVQEGFTHSDREIANLLRNSGKPVILAVNKTDHKEIDAMEFYEAGLGEPIAISAIHKRGLSDLLDEILKMIPESEITDAFPDDITRIAIVGKPNVGKSSFFNKLLGSDRVIVDKVAGTTRDPIDTIINYQDRSFVIVDTAGLRKRFQDSVEYYSFVRTEGVIEKSQLCFLLIDPEEGVTRDDLKIFSIIEKKGKACIVIANKWDLFTQKWDKNDYRRLIQQHVPAFLNTPIMFSSAKTGEGLQKILQQANHISRTYRRSYKTPYLNKIIEKYSNKLRIKIYYIVQMRTAPPKFLIFVSRPKNITDTHKATIKNILRNELALDGIPINIQFKSRNKHGQE